MEEQDFDFASALPSARLIVVDGLARLGSETATLGERDRAVVEITVLRAIARSARARLADARKNRPKRSYRRRKT